MYFRKMLLIVVCLISLIVWSNIIKTKSIDMEMNYSYEIINSYPHDSQAFTQGLVYYEGFLFESTGLYGLSSLRKVNLVDGVVQKQIDLESNVFGEGLTIINDSIVQLTWQEKLGYVYDLTNFNLLETFTYSTEGWGLTTDGEFLIMSDGSSVLTYLDPQTFMPVHQIVIESTEGPVEFLNELEYIEGVIYANIWLTDKIVCIDPDTGRVIGWIDLSGLLEPIYSEQYAVDVLNGIAYDNVGQRLFVTGKLWPVIYEIKVVPVH